VLFANDFGHGCPVDASRVTMFLSIRSLFRALSSMPVVSCARIDSVFSIPSPPSFAGSAAAALYPPCPDPCNRLLSLIPKRRHACCCSSHVEIPYLIELSTLELTAAILSKVGSGMAQALSNMLSWHSSQNLVVVFTLHILVLHFLTAQRAPDFHFFCSALVPGGGSVLK